MSGTLLEERRQFIEKKLLAEGKIKVSELAELFDVSSETIRKDLLFLEEKGIAKKGYGGAVVANELIEPSIAEKHKKYTDEKKEIAKKALEFISDGMIVFLDAGSTVYTFAQMLPIKNNLTVFTNSLSAAKVLDDFKITTYVVGGKIRHNSNAIVGGWAVSAINEIKADVAILGTSGFNDRNGPCVENFEESEVKKAMIESANKVVILGDSSKAKTYSMIEFAKWQNVDAFITDSKIDESTKNQIIKQTEIYTV
jgi:DeoR/GlpR family transcriptional regulator of sugar metabolism